MCTGLVFDDNDNIIVKNKNKKEDNVTKKPKLITKHTENDMLHYYNFLDFINYTNEYNQSLLTMFNKYSGNTFKSINKTENKKENKTENKKEKRYRRNL